MREAAGEASPAIYFQQQVCDLHMREHPIQPVPQFVGFLRKVVFQRTDLQTCAVQLHVRQLAVTGERIALIEGLVDSLAFFDFLKGDFMDEIETLNNPKKSSWPFSEEWTKAWKQLEEQVRQRPGPHLLMAFAIGYFLQIITFETFSC